jgi:hypothetical protein
MTITSTSCIPWYGVRVPNAHRSAATNVGDRKIYFLPLLFVPRRRVPGHGRRWLGTGEQKGEQKNPTYVLEPDSDVSSSRTQSRFSR